MSMWLWITLWVIFVVAVPHTLVFMASLRWSERNIVLAELDPERFMRRWQSPPWYVRYTARVLQHPLDPPSDVGP